MKLWRILTGALCALSIICTVPTLADGKTKSLKEVDVFSKTDVAADGYYMTAAGKVRVYEYHEHGAPSVYQWNKKKLKEVSDPFTSFVENASKKKYSGYIAPSAKSDGKTYYTASYATIYQYDEKGKIKNRVNLKSKLRLNKYKKRISECTWVKKDLVLIDTWQTGGENAGIYLVDVNKGKIVKTLPKKYKDVVAVGTNQLYLLYGDSATGTETLARYSVKKGKVDKKIKTSSLRDTAKDNTTSDDDFGALKDAALAGAVYKKSLYVKYIDGIYRWDIGKKKFVKAYTSTPEFGAGSLYGGEMSFDKKGTIYVMGYKTDDESPTNFYQYN